MVDCTATTPQGGLILANSVPRKVNPALIFDENNNFSNFYHALPWTLIKNLSEAF
jgi:hypothetical protein